METWLRLEVHDEKLILPMQHSRRGDKVIANFLHSQVKHTDKKMKMLHIWFPLTAALLTVSLRLDGARATDEAAAAAATRILQNIKVKNIFNLLAIASITSSQLVS